MVIFFSLSDYPKLIQIKNSYFITVPHSSHPRFVFICLILVILIRLPCKLSISGQMRTKAEQARPASPAVDQKSVSVIFFVTLPYQKWTTCIFLWRIPYAKTYAAYVQTETNRKLSFDKARKSDFRLWKLFRDFDFLIRQNHAALKILLATITWQAHVLSRKLGSEKLGQFWEKNEKIIFGKIAKPRFYLLTVKFRFSKMSHFNSHIIMKSWDSRISLPWSRLHLKQFSALGGTKQQSTNKCLIMFTEHVLLAKTNDQSEVR